MPELRFGEPKKITKDTIQPFKSTRWRVKMHYMLKN